MSIFRSHPGAAAILAIGWVAAGQAASAHSVPAALETVSVKVSYRDLNLDREAGAKALLVRIRRAAKNVCGNDPDDVLDGGRQYRACVAHATDTAVRKLDVPLVSAMNGGAAAPVSVILAAKR